MSNKRKIQTHQREVFFVCVAHSTIEKGEKNDID